MAVIPESPSFIEFLRPAAALCGVLVTVYAAWSYGRTLGKLPPGPQGSFVAGNVGDLPKEQPWKVFAKWGRQYGLFLVF